MVTRSRWSSTHLEKVHKNDVNKYHFPSSTRKENSNEHTSKLYCISYSIRCTVLYLMESLIFSFLSHSIRIATFGHTSEYGTPHLQYVYFTRLILKVYGVSQTHLKIVSNAFIIGFRHYLGVTQSRMPSRGRKINSAIIGTSSNLSSALM